MIVKKHTVKNYRNITDMTIEPSSSITVINGENGQGKTNLLESIWLLSGAKSFRNTKDADLIQKGSSFSVIQSSVLAEEQEEKEIKITISNDKQDRKGRFAAVNGVDYGRATSLAGTFYCVVFAPGHLSLVKGSPAGRRKFVDAALCQLYPSYIETFRRYTRLLSQKNALLKEMRIDASGKQPKKDLLWVLNQEFAKYAVEIREKRDLYITAIKETATEKYKKISREQEELTITYTQAEKDPALLLAKLERNIDQEIRLGFSLIGPHRDDITLLLNGEDTKIYASQGQQRSIALCLKLAEAQQIKTVTNEMPVVLLDDVLSELDMHRQHYLLNDLSSGQVIITSCETDIFTNHSGKIYEIENGALKE